MAEPHKWTLTMRESEREDRAWPDKVAVFKLTTECAPPAPESPIAGDLVKFKDAEWFIESIFWRYQRRLYTYALKGVNWAGSTRVLVHR